MPIPVASQSREWVSGRSLAGIAGSNPGGAWMYVSSECCVVSGRGLCDGPIQKSSLKRVYMYIIERDPYCVLYEAQSFLRS